MPRRGLRACPTPGCPELTPGGRCDECARGASRARSKRKNAGRGVQWQRTSEHYLREHPYCECDQCAQLPRLLRPPSQEVDHIDGLGPNGPRGHDWTNLRAMTKSHHSRRTAREQPGGWNDHGS